MFYQKMTNFCSWVYVCLNWIIFVHYNITQAIGKVTSEQVWRSSSTWVHYVILHIDFTFSMAFVCGLDNCKLRLTLCNFVCVKVNLLTYNFSLRNSNLWFFFHISSALLPPNCDLFTCNLLALFYGIVWIRCKNMQDVSLVDIKGEQNQTKNQEIDQLLWNLVYYLILTSSYTCCLKISSLLPGLMPVVQFL